MLELILMPSTSLCYRTFLQLAQLSAFTVAFSVVGIAQGPPKPLPPGPMLDEGTVKLIGPSLDLTLLRSSGTVAALNPASDPTLDYTPGDILKERSADTFYHLGDLDLRLRIGDASDWKDYSTAFRRQPVRMISMDATHFSADLAPTLPADIPLDVTRTWTMENGELSLRYTLTNRSNATVHLGGLGIPMVFNNIMNGRDLEQAYSKCSFYDPYIGEDAGYVQVARLTGLGPVLLAVPDGHTPFEVWKPILDHRSRDGKGLLLNDPTPRGATFEGSYDWMVHSAGFTETDWKGVQEWNPGTEAAIAPGETISYGLRFFVAPSLRQIEPTLAAHHRPVAVGIPGYILPQDIQARLFLRYQSQVHSIVSEPADAITIHDDGYAQDKDWHAYTLRGKQWGRARLVITYDDGTTQSIGYRTIKPEAETVADMGRFLFHQQWYTDTADPFHRAPSVISYDDEAGKQILQESRVWIAGLSDEAGAGSWIAASMKEFGMPDREEVAKLESFVNQTVWGHLQENAGEHKYGVHKSLFYYQPDAMPSDYYDSKIDWKSWTSWNLKDAADVGRSYNYPHVVAAYWSLYHIARNSTGLTTKPWQWYLDQAFETTMAMHTQAPYYTQFGQMEGTIFLRVLDDLKAEGWTTKASQLEAMMRERADHWRTEPYPFGSEMPWDSTGQEEVYDWTRYFGFDDKATVTLNAILAYTPVLPSWGYNGSARRYWDFLYGGKYPRIERQLHHYGSGLNAIPLLAEYRLHPTDLYLLRAGYGGVMGPLANIDQKGFASAAFHSFPDRMAYDPYSGDYGPNFFGHALNTAMYLTHDNKFGWICFGGNVEEHNGIIQATTLDSFRNRIFVAPIGLWLTLDAGKFKSIEYNPAGRSLRIHLAPASETVAIARLHVHKTNGAEGLGHTIKIEGNPKTERGAYIFPLGNKDRVVHIPIN